MRRIGVIIAVMLFTFGVIFLAMGISRADETRYILCDPSPTNHVAIRRSPKKGAEETGRLFCGDEILTDGKTKNGYLHILGMTEYGEGWVHQGYVVDDQPVIERCNATVAANGRVMSWRRISGGKSGWLDVCTEVRVYARSDEWAVTSKGYIKTKYLEIWHEDEKNKED